MARKWLDVSPAAKNGRTEPYIDIYRRGEDGMYWLSQPDVPENEWGYTAHQGFYNQYDNPNFNKFENWVTREQTKEDWRTLFETRAEAPDDGSTDGSLWERHVFEKAAIGPYDLTQGDQITFKVVYLFGEIDRNTSMRGGLAATQNYKDEGIADLLQNWENAQYLLNNNYQLPADAYPPPIPGKPPEIGFTDEEVEVEAFADIIDGEPSQGFDVSWVAVHDNYTDPGTGNADFAGYKLYRSQISYLGPWNEVADLTIQEAEQLREGDRINYRLQTDPGIPYRFAVTSYDTSGNESMILAYTIRPESAPRAPQNDMSRIKVVPNPFRQVSGFLDPGEANRLTFINIPERCTIRIYTLAGELVREIVHEGFGETAWGEAINNSYLETEFGEDVMPGLYIYHVTNNTSGYRGETHIGKIAIIR
jgi:hypothetical protein